MFNEESKEINGTYRYKQPDNTEQTITRFKIREKRSRHSEVSMKTY